MSDPHESASAAPPSTRQRRKSFVEMLNPRAFNSPSNLSTSPSNAVPASPATSGGRKSMSLALGLAGTGTQDSPFNAFARQRRASISTSSASSSPEFRNTFGDGAVIEEEDDKMEQMATPPSPSFARRLSFGAQALGVVRQTGTSPNNAAGEGFNWSDAMRDKKKRPSFSGNPFGHNRSKSFNPTTPQPPVEMPKPAPSPPAPASLRTKKPDHLGERMLRGEFMMD